jgi:UDP-N-acetylglucosamine 2-epimerase
MKISSVVGARPQFIKLAPLIRAIQEHNNSNRKPKIAHLTIHTGQHYDYGMNKIFFDDLGIQKPTYNLEVGSGPQGWQTGEMIRRAEEVLIEEKPDWVFVYGDTNSTLAGALAAAKLHIRVAHIEAGLRSYDKRMPEEINRVLIDHCSDILYCPTENAVKNLIKEGFTNIINKGKLINENTSIIKRTNINFHEAPEVINIGDIMYDALLISLDIAEKKSIILDTLKLKPKEYYLVTIHRAENTDDKNNLKNIMLALLEISKGKPVVFPVHPRTKKTLEKLRVSQRASNKLHMIEPISYFDMLVLLKNANKILTDSGGVQKEAYILGIPCITMRNNTEWIETVESGWNVIVGADQKKITESILKSSPIPNSSPSEVFGDGKTAKKIVNILLNIRG